MGLKARLSSYCTKRANNGVNLVTSRNINTRLARPIGITTRNTIPANVKPMRILRSSGGDQYAHIPCMAGHTTPCKHNTMSTNISTNRKIYVHAL